MDWKSLLNNRRLDLESYETRSTGAHVAEIHSSQGDVDRVLYSSAFRRLKGKTQVFMFPPTDYHRDRLTHSLEVYNISRNLVSTIIRRVEASPEGAAYGLVDAMRLKGVDMLDVVDSISAAALAHDIGNTPFGHIGEHAIRSWFREYSDMLPSFNEELDEHERTDFFHFDGNAQAFRVVSRLQGWSEGGLRLSYMTLGALIKYPQPSPATNKNKFGYFKSDLEPFLKVCHELDLKSVTPTTFSRHPFAFIVEAADDIAYRTTDVEDGVKSRLIPHGLGYDLLYKYGATNELIRNNVQIIGKNQDKIKYLRAATINNLVDVCANTFIKKSADIMEGRSQKSLLENSPLASFEKDSKSLLEEYVYYEPEKMRNEAGAHTIIGSLLGTFSDLVEDYHRCGRDFSRLTERNKNVVHILGKGKRDLYVDSAYNLYQIVVDFVSGMTDRYATNLYRNLEGNSLTMR